MRASLNLFVYCRSSSSLMTSAINQSIVHGHVYSRGIVLKKANHYNNFDCYTLGNTKPVVGTSENVAEPDYDVFKKAAILNFNTHLRCFIISIIVDRFQIFRYQNVQNGKCFLFAPKQND